VHKWAKEIIAFVNGKAVEYRRPDCDDRRWRVVNTLGAFQASNREFRIAPPKKKYRVASMNFPDDTTYVCTASCAQEEKNVEERHHFIRWLTDWVEYE